MTLFAELRGAAKFILEGEEAQRALHRSSPLGTRWHLLNTTDSCIDLHVALECLGHDVEFGWALL